MAVTITRAMPADVDAVAPLFDAYRQFYGKPADAALARAFIAERMNNKESVIFVARADDGSAVGFAQLYPVFSSVSAGRSFILNDLFVAPGTRR